MAKPLKIGIQTWGSNGDIRPMIALAHGLQQAGHRVSLVVSSVDNRRYDDTCAALNIAYQQIPAHISFDLQAFAQRSFKLSTLSWLTELLECSFFPYETEIYQASQNLAATHDLVIGHHFLYPLKLAAKKQGIPYISVTFCHGAIPTAGPPFTFPNLGPFLSKWQWQLLDFVFDWALKKRLSRLWFAEAMPEFKHVFSGLLTSDLLNLVAVDPLLCPGRVEWSPLHQACGFLNLPNTAESWQASPALLNFLGAGDKPIYMTFGSLQQAVPEWSMALFIEAVKLCGCRAIIQTSSSRYPADSQLGQIFFVGRHPHQALFRQCAAVVHHGGAGTTHSASLCGCPSVVVPFMDEQQFWGCQLEKTGLAPPPIHAKKVTAAKLAATITQALNDHKMTETAQQAAQALAATDGVAQAVALIEQAVFAQCGN